MLTFRALPRCALCERARDPMCEQVRADAERMTWDLNKLAACSHRRLPDAELVLDCRSFWRAGRAKNLDQNLDQI